MFNKCPRCGYQSLEEMQSYTICYECNWSLENDFYQLGQPYYYPINVNLKKQLKEAEELLNQQKMIPSQELLSEENSFLPEENSFFPKKKMA